MTRMSKHNVAEQMRTLSWNFRLNFWINQYNLVIAMFSVPVVVVILILLFHFRRAVNEWPVALTLIVGLFTFAYTVQKQGSKRANCSGTSSASSITGTMRWTRS